MNWQEGKDGVVWVSTQVGRCLLLESGDTYLSKIPQSPDRQNILSLFASDDLVGVGYFKGGIDLIIPGVTSFCFFFHFCLQTLFEGRFRHSIPHNLVSVKVPCLPFTAIVGEQSGWVMAGTSSFGRQRTDF